MTHWDGLPKVTSFRFAPGLCLGLVAAAPSGRGMAQETQEKINDPLTVHYTRINVVEISHTAWLIEYSHR